MPRALSPALDQVMLSDRRQPRYQVFVFDIRSTEDEITPTTINDIVAGNPLPAIVGPREFTQEVQSVTIQEQAGDLVEGIAASNATFRVVDRLNRFDPITGAQGRWLRQGNVVRVVEGDAQVEEAEWETTFTGKIFGQPGFVDDRNTARRFLSVRCLDRMAGFLKQNLTSAEFGQNTTYTSMIDAMAQDDMNLLPAEINFPAFGIRVVEHVVAQCVMEAPIVCITKVTFGDGFTPKFDGSGVLTLVDAVTSKTPARFYSDDQNVKRIERPPLDLNAQNCVEVLGLDKDMSPVVSPLQKIAAANITLGYYTENARLTVLFSDDGTQQVQNSELHVLHSVDGGIMPTGGETWTPLAPDPIFPLIETSGIIRAKSGFHPAVTIIIQVFLVVTAAVPDLVITAGFIASTGVTIAIGRIINALVEIGLAIIQSTIGNGQYEIWAEPVEFIFAELRGKLCAKGLNSADEDVLEIQNHFINTQTEVDTAAERVLKFIQAQQNQRSATAIHDLRLEPTDIFEMKDERRYFIEMIERTLIRGGDAEATYACFEVTPGTRP